jgi:ABC-type multidrug transport system fused ATPase/permease subunit
MLSVGERRYSLRLFGLMLVGTVLELLGVGLVVPVVAIALRPDLSSWLPHLSEHLTSLNQISHELLVSISMSGLFISYFLKNIFLAFLIKKQTAFAYGVQEKLSKRLFTIYLRQPYIFHLQRNSAELVRNITGEVVLFTAVLTSGMLMLTELLVVLSVVGLLLLVEPFGATFAFILFVGSALIFNRLTRKRVSLWGAERQRNDGLRYQHLQQGLGGVKDVKLLGRDDEFIAKFQTYNAYSNSAWRAQVTLQSYPRLMFEMLAVLGLVILVLSMVFQKRDLSSIVPTLSLFAAAAFRLTPSLNRIVFAVQNLRYSLPVIDLLSHELQLAAPAPTKLSSNERVLFNDEVFISDLVYRYSCEAPPALDGVNIRIKRGESVGVIGTSGSGKSTLVDVILGLLQPDSGRVAVDGEDVQQNLRNWQDQIGYVPQVIYLTDDTLTRNIAFGVPDEEIDKDSVERVIKAAQLGELIKMLPDGLNTIVGEHGVRLSGGQRQRIGIARALYHDPAVLVLDEATSALDTTTELEVMEAIMALRGLKTIIIVAHRLSTLKKCDRLIRLEAGRIIPN